MYEMASSLSRGDKAKAVAVRIAGETAAPEPDRRRLCVNCAWGDQRKPVVSREARQQIQAFHDQGGLPVRDVVRAEIGRGGPAVTRGQIFE
jgi:hypothetical protein